MSYNERFSVITNLKSVTNVINFDDTDNSACDAISKVKQLYPDHHIIFANGGDRTSDNIPEMEMFEHDSQVSFIFGIGGDDKKNSSSWILNEWKHPSESRIWGKFITYYESEFTKVKRLLLEPNKSISMQYHTQRSELWFIESGSGIVSTLDQNNIESTLMELNTHDYYIVPVNTWHKLVNNGKEILSVIEIQYGKSCTESDIIRYQHNP